MGIRVEDGKVVVESWFTATKQKSALKSALSTIVNLMNGVQTKFKKIMRLAYSHFPINVTIEGGGKYCEIRNFLGEKIVPASTCLVTRASRRRTPKMRSRLRGPT